MTTFLESYARGQQLVVFNSRGSMIGIPCGFVIFSDGLAWVDDGVLAVDYASHHTHHHFFGVVAANSESIVCNGHTFSPAPLQSTVFNEAWNSLGLTAGEWVRLHHAQELRLSVERASFKPRCD